MCEVEFWEVLKKVRRFFRDGYPHIHLLTAE